MKITDKTRTWDSYLEKISVKSETFVKSSKISKNSFDSFLNEKYDTSLDDVILELLELDDEKRIDTACDLCQSWINLLSKIKAQMTNVEANLVFQLQKIDMEIVKRQ